MLAEKPPMESNPEFRDVFLWFYEPVVHLFRRFGFNDEVARELTQETFLRVYKGWESFRGEAQYKTWIYQIARNIALNEIRGRRTQKREGSEVPLEEGRNPDDEGQRDGIWAPGNIGGTPLEDALQTERKVMLGKALQQLPPQMRRCVELRVHGDLKYKEIAAILDMSPETVKAHLFQARQKLREKLSDYFSDPDSDNR